MTPLGMSIDYRPEQRYSNTSRVHLTMSIAFVLLAHLAIGILLLRHKDTYIMKNASTSASGVPIRVSMVSIARPIVPVPPVPVEQPKKQVKATPHAIAVKAPAARQIDVNEVRVAPPVPPSVALEAPSAQAAISKPAQVPGPPMVATPKTLSAGELKQLACRIPAPVYPRKAKRLQEAGSVVMSVEIDTQGRLAEVQVTQSSGFEDLDTAAVEAMRSGSCLAYLDGGVPRAVIASQRIDFTLPD